MKKFLLLTVMCVLGLFGTLRAQTILVGNGADESEWPQSYGTPVDVYSSYGMSQQIYTAEEITSAGGYVGVINQIAFKRAENSGVPTRNWSIYLTNITDNAFASENGFNKQTFLVSAEDKVYSGSFNITSGWNVFNLSDFEYTGGNLLVTVVDNTGTGGGDVYWHNHASDLAITATGSQYKPETTTYGLYGSNRNYIQLTFAEGGNEGGDTPVEPTLAAPTNLVATVNGQSSITLTWDAVDGAADYYVYVNGALDANTNGATTHTYEGLTQGTEYCYAVAAVAADYENESELSETVCATTEAAQLAENEILVGTATSTYYSPFLTILGGGSRFETIYRAEEIGKACTISEISFSYNSGDPREADVNIYFAETTKTEYANPNDVTADEDLTLVYSGTVVTLCDSEWETFVLDAPYEYSGENNLVVVVTTDNTCCANQWNCYTEANSVLIEGLGLDNHKPVMKLTLGEGGNDTPVEPTLTAPQNFVATANGQNEIVLTWETVEGAENYIIYEGIAYVAELEADATTYTVTGLTAGTEHCYTINAWSAAAGNGPTAEACATTEAEQEEPGDVCVVDFVLTDSYGDGWNGNYLLVEYNGTSTNLVNENLDGGYNTAETQTYSLEIPQNTHVTVTYTVANQQWTYPSENSFIIKYVSGEEIVNAGPFGSLEQGQSETFEFDVNCTPKAPATPKATATVTGESTIALEWNEVATATAYNVYCGAEVVASNLTATTYNAEGLTPSTEYCYTVTALNEIGESEASESVCATTLAEGSILVAIGDGTIEQIAAPVYNAGPSPVYSLTQQIYTADEIGLENGLIESVSFYQVAGDNHLRNIVVYLQNVDKALFDGTHKDWISFSDSDIVYEGEFNFGKAGEWITIEFQNPMEYKGGNVALTVYDLTGTGYGYDYTICDKVYSSQVDELRGMFYTATAEIDFSQLSTFYGSFMNTGYWSTPANANYVNNVKFVVTPVDTPVEPTLAAPTNLVATVNGQSSITLTWDAVDGAADYYVYVNGALDANTNGATTHTYEGLTQGTEYCYAVAAVAADYENESELSETVCATTEAVQVAENEIIVGTATSKSYAPFCPALGNSHVEMIYRAEEIGKACTISEMSFSYASGNEALADIEIYLAETTKSVFSGESDVTAETELTLVYTGTDVTLSNAEWNTFVLDAPFAYSGENNLLVVAKMVSEAGATAYFKWNSYNDPSTVIIKDMLVLNDKPVMKLTLGEGGNDTPVEPVAPEYFLTSVKGANSWNDLHYYYDESGKLVKILGDVSNFDNGWSASALLFDYNDNGTLAGYTEGYVYSYEETEVDETSQYSIVTYEYTDGLLTSYTNNTHYTWQDPTTDVTAYTYTADGKIETIATDYEKTTFTYNAEGLVSEKVVEYFNGEEFVVSAKELYTYENGKVVESNYYYFDQWEANDFVLQDTYGYEYDENGNCVSKTTYGYSYEDGSKEAREVVEYTHNTEVDNAKVFSFVLPHEALRDPVAPAHVNVITEKLSYRYQENWETGEVEKVDESVTKYNYTPELPGTPVEPEPEAPAAPDYVYADGISESEIELGWYYWNGTPEGFAGYNVYQVEGETYTLLADSVATESYIVKGLAAETEYAFAVTALANGLESEYSEVAYAETYATEPDAVVPVADYYRVASKMNLAYGYLSGTTYKYLSDSTDVVTEIVDEQLGQTSKLIYNENGQLTGYINVYEDWETGEPVEDTAGVTYAYNEQGLLASCTETYYDYWTYQYVTTTDSYTYNEQGQLVELVSESMGTVSEFAYNEDGTLATRTDYYVYEDETTGESSKELNLKYVYVYETGKLVKVNYYYDDVTEGEVEDYEEFEYDEKGNCVKATAYEYGAPYLIVEYEYNTEVAAEKVTPCFEFPQYVLQFSNFVYADYAHQPSSVNILTKERVTRCYPDYETGELVSYPDGVTIYNYEGWVKPSDGPVNPEPTVPAAPEVYAFADNGAVILVWNPVPTATKYAVYQGEDKLGELTDTIVGVNVMGPGEYCFTVTAFNEIGESEHSNLACATVEIPEDTEKPAAPVLTATIENNKIVLSWNAVEGATYYSVYNEGQLLGYIQETTVSLDLPQEYGTYCFTVTASNIAGESEHSNVACVVYGDGIAENEATLNVYPNPVENMLFIETESYIEEVSIYTITGTMIYSEVDFNSNSIDVSDFNGGVYIMKVRTENGEIVKRFIKK